MGRIKEAHGLSGQLYAIIPGGIEGWGDEVQEIILKKADFEQNFTLKKIKQHSSQHGFIVSLKEVTDRTYAEKLLGCTIEIPDEYFISKSGEGYFLRELLGYEVYFEKALWGKIQDFSTNGAQDLLVIESESQIIEVPFIKEWTEKIDDQAKVIWMQLPDDFLSLARDKK